MELLGCLPAPVDRSAFSFPEVQENEAKITRHPTTNTKDANTITINHQYYTTYYHTKSIRKKAVSVKEVGQAFS